MELTDNIRDRIAIARLLLQIGSVSFAALKLAKQANESLFGITKEITPHVVRQHRNFMRAVSNPSAISNVVFNYPYPALLSNFRVSYSIVTDGASSGSNACYGWAFTWRKNTDEASNNISLNHGGAFYRPEEQVIFGVVHAIGKVASPIEHFDGILDAGITKVVPMSEGWDIVHHSKTLDVVDVMARFIIYWDEIEF